MMGKLGLCFNTPPPAMRNVALAAILIGISFLAHSQDKADVILYNGKLITMETTQCAGAGGKRAAYYCGG